MRSPPSTYQAILMVIDALCKPIQQKQKRRRKRAAVVVAAVAVVACLSGGMVWASVAGDSAVVEDSTYLDGEYAVFGYVTEGMDLVDQICESAQPTDDNGTIPAEEQPVITSVVIRDVKEQQAA